MGKTTLSRIVANELGVNIKETSGPVIEKPGDLAGLLTNLEPNDVLFIDEIHRLSTVVEEYLYAAMEDYRIDIMIDSGPNARSVQINLNPFTLIGATTRSGLLTAPLLSRFGIKSRLEYYDANTLQHIILRSASILGTKITSDAAAEIARRSRGTPRIANGLLRRVRDFAQVLSNGVIDLAITEHALRALNVDKHGLDEMDNRILSVIIEKFKGGPVGITTIATAVGEEAGTLEEVYEPFLIQEGFIQRTARGREATAKAYEHLGKKSGRAGGGCCLGKNNIPGCCCFFIFSQKGKRYGRLKSGFKRYNGLFRGRNGHCFEVFRAKKLQEENDAYRKRKSSQRSVLYLRRAYSPFL